MLLHSSRLQFIRYSRQTLLAPLPASSWTSHTTRCLPCMPFRPFRTLSGAQSVLDWFRGPLRREESDRQEGSGKPEESEESKGGIVENMGESGAAARVSGRSTDQPTQITEDSQNSDISSPSDQNSEQPQVPNYTEHSMVSDKSHNQPSELPKPSDAAAPLTFTAEQLSKIYNDSSSDLSPEEEKILFESVSEDVFHSGGKREAPEPAAPMDPKDIFPGATAEETRKLRKMVSESYMENKLYYQGMDHDPIDVKVNKKPAHERYRDALLHLVDTGVITDLRKTLYEATGMKYEVPPGGAICKNMTFQIATDADTLAATKDPKRIPRPWESILEKCGPIDGWSGDLLSGALSDNSKPPTVSQFAVEELCNYARYRDDDSVWDYFGPYPAVRPKDIYVGTVIAAKYCFLDKKTQQPAVGAFVALVLRNRPSRNVFRLKLDQKCLKDPGIDILEGPSQRKAWRWCRDPLLEYGVRDVPYSAIIECVAVAHQNVYPPHKPESEQEFWSFDKAVAKPVVLKKLQRILAAREAAERRVDLAEEQRKAAKIEKLKERAERTKLFEQMMEAKRKAWLEKKKKRREQEAAELEAALRAERGNEASGVGSRSGNDAEGSSESLLTGSKSQGLSGSSGSSETSSSSSGKLMTEEEEFEASEESKPDPVELAKIGTAKWRFKMEKRMRMRLRKNREFMTFLKLVQKKKKKRNNKWKKGGKAVLKAEKHKKGKKNQEY